MKSFLTIAPLFCVLLGLNTNALAEQIEVPHDFQPNTPAKASEINENFGAIVQALAALTSLVMYEGGEVVGKSVLHNIFKLNSNYLTVAQTNKGDPNIYVGRARKTGSPYYLSSDCTGDPYLNGAVFELELYLGEAGYVFGLKELEGAFIGGLASDLETQTIQSIKFGAGCFPIQPTELDVYPIIPNDPNITGVTTAPCLKGTSPRTCFSNASIVRE